MSPATHLMKHERSPLAFSGPSLRLRRHLLRLRNCFNPKRGDELMFIESNLPNFYDYMHDDDDDSGSESSQ
uniref:Uncharacterized protein n=1 Tax=Hyaloperonospora arabidopsidis (strain Emoy2) TaxID=559515 RepID=M4C405_HYAAE